MNLNIFFFENLTKSKSLTIALRRYKHTHTHTIYFYIIINNIVSLYCYWHYYISLTYNTHFSLSLVLLLLICPSRITLNCAKLNDRKKIRMRTRERPEGYVCVYILEMKVMRTKRKAFEGQQKFVPCVMEETTFHQPATNRTKNINETETICIFSWKAHRAVKKREEGRSGEGERDTVCFIYKIILSAILCDIKFERRYFAMYFSLFRFFHALQQTYMCTCGEGGLYNTHYVEAIWG